MGAGRSPVSCDQERVTYNIARLKKGSEKFEIVIDPDKAIAFKNGEGSYTIKDVLSSEKIYSDAKKGMVASEQLMESIFKTKDALAVAEAVIKEGQIQLTPEHRKKVLEQKRRRIIDLIHTNGVDPKTHLPHPITRIENALVEAKVRIDEFKSPDRQVPEIIKQLRPIIPIRFEIKELEIKIPAQYAAKSYSLVQMSSKILKTSWLNDGSCLMVVEVPGGMWQDFSDKLNSFTHGNVEVKVLSTK
jgi:ribosome maturation protein SDO1